VGSYAHAIDNFSMPTHKTVQPRYFFFKSL